MKANAHCLFRYATLSVAVMLGMMIPSASAQELTPTEFDTAQAQDFVGDWVLTMEMQGAPVEVQLAIQDVDGKLGALVTVPQLPDSIPATVIAKTDEGIDISFPVDFGGQMINLTMTLTQKIAGNLLGNLSDDNGMLSADLEGVPAGSTEDAAAPLKASDIDTSTMGSYIGSWDLAMDIGGRPFTVTLQFLDFDGKVTSLFLSPFSPEPQNVPDITMSEEGTRLAFDVSMGGQTIPAEVWITRAAETLDGEFSAMGGALKAEFVGIPTDKDLLAKFSSVDENTRRRSRGGGTVQTDVKIDGNEIRVRYTALKSDSPAVSVLDNLKDGDVFTYTDGRTIKLFSDADLMFGDVLLRTENAGPNYPGVYSLWLKKSGDGWRLVANRDADILGSQYDVSADIAEFPVSVSSGSEDIGPMLIELQEEGNGGVLKIMWGKTVWTAPFKLGERTIAKAE